MVLLFAFPEYEELTANINKELGFKLGDVTVRHFPDGESFVKLSTDVKGKDVIVVCGLDNPDQKAMALMFFTNVAKELGANKVGLIAPYLGYMRQDKKFHDGEAITSNIFAKFLSEQIDWLVTIDPHLHRHKSLDEIYSIPSKVLHASDAIAAWIKTNIKNPVLIGPDEESEQWVSDVAKKAGSPFIVLTKIRHGDKEVEVSIPDVEKYNNRTPVLVDDIISTARTMIETTEHLKSAGIQPAICIGVHAIFADNAYEELKKSSVSQIVTCNTITHPSNKIDISSLIAEAVKSFV